MGPFVQLYSAAVEVRDSDAGDRLSSLSSGWPIQSGVMLQQRGGQDARRAGVIITHQECDFWCVCVQEVSGKDN